MSRRHADIWSHPGHYLVDPYTWPWSPNGHSHGHQWPPTPLFHVNRTSHSEIQLFQNLTMKILCQGRVVKVTFHLENSKVKVMAILGWDIANSIFDLEIQGQGHGQGQTRWSHSRPWVQSICLLFVLWQSDENQPKSNQVIYRSGPTIVPKMKEIQKVIQNLSAAGGSGSARTGTKT